MNLDEFISDYNSFMLRNDLMVKYGISEYIYKQLLKRYNLNRDKTNKSLRFFNNISGNANFEPSESINNTTKAIKHKPKTNISDVIELIEQCRNKINES